MSDEHLGAFAIGALLGLFWVMVRAVDNWADYR